jgi:protein AATF/BFR2
LLKLRDVSSLSSLRHHLDYVIEPKYVGVKTSRKQLEEDSVFGAGFEDLHDQGGYESQSAASEGSSNEGKEQVLSQGDEEESGDEEILSPPRLMKHARENTENNLSLTIRQRRDQDRKKGRAVSKQLVSEILRQEGPTCTSD